MKELQREKNKSSVSNGISLIVTLGLALTAIVAAFAFAFMNMKK